MYSWLLSKNIFRLSSNRASLQGITTNHNLPWISKVMEWWSGHIFWSRFFTRRFLRQHLRTPRWLRRVDLRLDYTIWEWACDPIHSLPLKSTYNCVQANVSRILTRISTAMTTPKSIMYSFTQFINLLVQLLVLLCWNGSLLNWIQSVNGLMVRILPFQGRGPGSIPGWRIFIFLHNSIPAFKKKFIHSSIMIL